jgi:hypothetical protein
MYPDFANACTLEGVIAKLVRVATASAFAAWRVVEDG